MSKTDSVWERTVIELSAIGRDSEEDLRKRIDKGEKAEKEFPKNPLLKLYIGDAYCRLAEKSENEQYHSLLERGEFYLLGALVFATGKDPSLKKFAETYKQRVNLLLAEANSDEKKRMAYLRESDPPEHVRRLIEIYNWVKEGYKLPTKEEGEKDSKAEKNLADMLRESFSYRSSTAKVYLAYALAKLIYRQHFQQQFEDEATSTAMALITPNSPVSAESMAPNLPTILDLYCRREGTKEHFSIYQAPIFLAAMLLKEGKEEHALAALEYTCGRLGESIKEGQKPFKLPLTSLAKVKNLNTEETERLLSRAETMDGTLLEGIVESLRDTFGKPNPFGRNPLPELKEYRLQAEQALLAHRTLLALHRKRARAIITTPEQRRKRSKEEYTACIKLNPSDLESRIMLARWALADSDYSGAVRHYEALLFETWKSEPDEKTSAFSPEKITETLQQPALQNVFLEQGELVIYLYARCRCEVSTPASAIIPMIRGTPYQETCTLVAKISEARHAGIPLNTAKRRVGYFGYDPMKLPEPKGKSFMKAIKNVLRAQAGG